MLRITNRFEILIEYLINTRLDQNVVLEVLSLFEIYKAYNKLRKFYLNKK